MSEIVKVKDSGRLTLGSDGKLRVRLNDRWSVGSDGLMLSVGGLGWSLGTADQYWSLPAAPSVPAPLGATLYAGNDTAFTAAWNALATGGGTIVIDAAGTYAARTFTEPTSTIWITTGTDAGGGVGLPTSQPLPAIKYARNTRATIPAITLASGITTVKFAAINVGSATNAGDEYLYCVYTSATSSHPDAYFYNCEIFGIALPSSTMSLQIKVSDTSGFNVNDVVTGAVSGASGTVLKKIGTTNGYLLLSGVTPTPGSATYTNFVGPFNDTENLQVGGVTKATYKQPWVEVTVSGSAIVAGDIGNTVSGASYSGKLEAVSGNVLSLSNTSSKLNTVGFTASETLTCNGHTATYVSTSYTANTNQQSPTQVYGFRAQQGYGAMVIHGCYFHDLEAGIKCGTGHGGGVKDVLLYDNDVDNTYRSGMALYRPTTNPPRVLHMFNRTTRCFGYSGDAPNPHSEGFALNPNGATNVWDNVYSWGNIAIGGFSRSPHTGHLFDDTGSTGRNQASYIGNLFVDYSNTATSHTLSILDSQNSFIAGNVSVVADPASAPTISYPITTQDSNSTASLGGTVITSNIKANGASNTATDTYGNYAVKNTVAEYETVLTGPFPLTSATMADRAAVIAEAVAACAIKAGGPMAGYIGLADYMDKRISLSKVPFQFYFDGMIDQANGATNVTTPNWRKNWVLGNSTLTATDGTVSYSDDTSGTNQSAWASSLTVPEGKYAKIRRDAAAVAATLVTASADQFAGVSPYSVITAPALTYTGVDNNKTTAGTAARLYKTAMGQSAFNVALFAIRIRKDAMVNSGYLWSDAATGASVRCQNSGTSNLRCYLAGTGAAVNIAGAIAAASSAVYSTILISFDLRGDNYLDFSTAVKCTVDNVVKAVTVQGTWLGTVQTMALQGASGGSFGILDKGNATEDTPMNAAIEFMWADWGLDTLSGGKELPNIYDSAEYAKFYKDFIGADGSGITGAQPKICIYGDATYWNGPTVTNHGSAGDFIKAGSASFT